MQIPREKSLSPSAFGVYPRPRELPSPVCCFRIMHIRTGAMWIAYCDMLWITSQISFWAAQAVAGAWSPFSIILGFCLVIAQIAFVVYLVKGVRQFRLSLLLVYMLGIILRIVILLTMFFVVVFSMLFSVDDASLTDFQSLAWLKIIWLASFILLKIYALIVVKRCHDYIKRTKDFFRVPREILCCQKLDMTSSKSYYRGNVLTHVPESESMPSRKLPPLNEVAEKNSC